MAMRRLLALAAAATVAADVVQVAVLCNYIEARIADRQDCDAIIAAVDAINDKEDGVLDDLLPGTILNLTVAFEGCGDNHPDTGVGDDAFEVWKALPIQDVEHRNEHWHISVQETHGLSRRSPRSHHGPRRSR